MQPTAQRLFASLLFVLFGLALAQASSGKLPPIYTTQPMTIQTADGTFVT